MYQPSSPQSTLTTAGTQLARTSASSATTTIDDGSIHSNGSRLGSLSVTILSAYDLPSKEQPLSVSLCCLDQCVNTASPSARHKDRNSFKFPNQPLCVQAPLPLLYPSTATLTVHYRLPEKNLQATLALQTLKIQQPTWLILNLTPVDPNNTSYAQQQRSTSSQSFSSLDSPVLPTLRIQVELKGPYRPEIASIIALSHAWFHFVDRTQGGVDQIVKTLPKSPLPDKKYLLIPAVPFLTILVVFSPMVLGVLILGLPILLPIVVLVFLFVLCMLTFLLGLAASTMQGRTTLGHSLQPLLHTILSTTSGQRLVFETGPRPTSVRVARLLLPKGMMAKLILSLTMDLIGSSSYLLPLVGEGFDLIWAPMQTLLLMAMYDSVTPNLKYLSFMEELLPFTDVIPSGTMGWLAEFGRPLLLGKSSSITTTTNSKALATINTAQLLQSKRD